MSRRLTFIIETCGYDTIAALAFPVSRMKYSPINTWHERLAMFINYRAEIIVLNTVSS